MKLFAFVSISLFLSGCGDFDGSDYQRTLQPAIDPISFRACVDRQAPLAFEAARKKSEAAALYGYHTDINTSVISVCTSASGARPSERDMAYVNAAVEAEVQGALTKEEAEETMRMQRQDAIDAQNEKMEKYDEKRTTSIYYACLAQHAKTLALVSTESADLVAQAALSSCPLERTALVDVLNHYVPSTGFEIVNKWDASFAKKLLLEVIKARAIHPAPAQGKPNAPPPI